MMTKKALDSWCSQTKTACGFARWRFRRNSLVLPVLAFICTNALATATDIVERRGDESTLHGEVLEVRDAGVWFRPETGASRWISWDRVRRIEASSSIAQENATKYEEMAEDLWRARTRVERNDTALAEVIFEQYFKQYRGETNETALVVAEGLLRCYLARDARVLALIPAMEVARLRAAEVKTISYSTLPPVVDEQTLLCPWLPPVWSGALGLGALERSIAEYESTEHEVVAVIAALYRRSIQRELDGNEGRWTAGRLNAIRHPGVELLRDLVASTERSGDGRRAARVRLERRLNRDELTAHGEWAEAWTRYHIGRSLLDERAEQLKMRGLLNLAHVPARFGASQPYLAGLALAQIGAWHEASRDAEAAASIRSELERRYPNHPALQDGSAFEFRDVDDS